MSGIGNSAAFARSGTPVVVGAGTHTLKYVSRAIVLCNGTGGGDPAATISFDGDATTLSIPAGQTIRMEVRCLGFIIAGANASVVVELTDISSNSLSAGALDITRANLVTSA